MALSNYIVILECFYATEPVSILTTTLFLNASVQTDPEAALAWNSSSSASGALFSVTTGALELSYITVWHNSSSKGAILSLTGNGNISLIVWNVFVFMDCVL
jgi:hypothetical protein